MFRRPSLAAVLALAAVLGFAACATAQAPQAPPLAQVDQLPLWEPLEFAYGDHPLQRLDVYPHAPGAPVVAFVHGGGWCRGDKRQWTANTLSLAHRLSAVYTFVSLNYRLAADTNVPPAHPYDDKFPAGIEDLRSALAWLQSHGDWDATRVVIVGESGGANLAAYVATDGYSPNVLGAVLYAGYYRLDQDTGPLVGELRFNYVGCASETARGCKTRLQAASPYYAGMVQPAMLLVHGSMDDLVPMTQSAWLQSWAGYSSQLISVPGGLHTGITMLDPLVEAKVEAFVAGVVGGSP